jgi:hypothetical protein
VRNNNISIYREGREGEKKRGKETDRETVIEIER